MGSDYHRKSLIYVSVWVFIIISALFLFQRRGKGDQKINVRMHSFEKGNIPFMPHFYIFFNQYSKRICF
jgi:hypothetical protein